MSTKTGEGVNFKVVAFGDQTRQPCNFKVLTLEKLTKWINAQSLDPTVKEELVKKATTYPTCALPSFRKNFQTHLSKAQKIVRDKTPLYTKELGDDDEPESNTPTTLFDGIGVPQEIPESPHEDSFG